MHWDENSESLRCQGLFSQGLLFFRCDLLFIFRNLRCLHLLILSTSSTSGPWSPFSMRVIRRIFFYSYIAWKCSLKTDLGTQLLHSYQARAKNLDLAFKAAETQTIVELPLAFIYWWASQDSITSSIILDGVNPPICVIPESVLVLYIYILESHYFLCFCYPFRPIFLKFPASDI